jgi:hypothetical protein
MRILKASEIVSNAAIVVKRQVQRTNDKFNALTQKRKRIVLLIFGVAMGGVSCMLIIQALSNKENNERISIQDIKIPKDIYMKDGADISEETLIPVGKLKGEIDGEFKAFYVAVDRSGKTYINHSIDFSEKAYQKANGWEEISKPDLDRYQRLLHFLPARTKGLKP